MSQAAKKIQANRETVRAAVVPEQIQGLLTTAEQKQMPFLVWDVSAKGLGIWCPEQLVTHEYVRLTVSHPFPILLDFRVEWCRQSPDNDGFRAGLSAGSESKPLRSLYEYFCAEAAKLAKKAHE